MRPSAQGTPTANIERIFDARHYDQLNSSRAATVSQFLAEVRETLKLRTAVDVGCGLGYFSGLLRSIGLGVTGVEGRQENAEEAERRNPGVQFHTLNAEDPALRSLGKFDLVFCFGLLYHLENPFLTIRHLHAMTGRLLIVEGVILPGDPPMMGLLDEWWTEDQGLNHVALYPTESCLVKMLYRSGFEFVYKFTPMPDHPGYRPPNGLPRVRTMLAASSEPITSRLVTPVAEAHVTIQPANAVDVAATIRALNVSKGFGQWWLAQRLHVRRETMPRMRQKLLEITFPLRKRLGLRREGSHIAEEG